MAFLLLADHFARGKREQDYFVFLSGAAVMLSIFVLGNHFLEFRIIGEPGRLFPELDMILIAFSVELLRRLWYAPARFAIARRAAVIIIIALAWSTSIEYLQNRRSIFRTDYNLDDRVEYQMQDWMARNMPTARAMTGGAVRFWYNAWHDLPQLGGGSEQGLTNSITMPSQWDILMGPDGTLSTLWMQVLGIDAVLVNDKTSKEHYHDYQYPQKFVGRLPVVYDDKAGNWIHRVPRRYDSLARVVDRARIYTLPTIPWNGDIPSLQAWYDAVEKGPEAPTSTRWEGTDILHVKAPVSQGQAVLVQVSYDQNWRAYSAGQRLPLRNTKLGFILIEAPPGDHEIRLEFPTPFSHQVGRAVTVLSLIVAVGLISIGIRRRRIRT
jgi:hypothetical protein